MAPQQPTAPSLRAAAVTVVTCRPPCRLVAGSPAPRTARRRPDRLAHRRRQPDGNPVQHRPAPVRSTPAAPVPAPPAAEPAPPPGRSPRSPLRSSRRSLPWSSPPPRAPGRSGSGGSGTSGSSGSGSTGSSGSKGSGSTARAPRLGQHGSGTPARAAPARAPPAVAAATSARASPEDPARPSPAWSRRWPARSQDRLRGYLPVPRGAPARATGVRLHPRSGSRSPRPLTSTTTSSKRAARRNLSPGLPLNLTPRSPLVHGLSSASNSRQRRMSAASTVRRLRPWRTSRHRSWLPVPSAARAPAR